MVDYDDEYARIRVEKTDDHAYQETYQTHVDAGTELAGKGLRDATALMSIAPCNIEHVQTAINNYLCNSSKPEESD